MDPLRSNDGFVFQRLTGGIRKPAVRFHLASGRQVELLSFHLEPDWPRHKLQEIAKRLHPNEPAVAVVPASLEPMECAFACIAVFYSDKSAKDLSDSEHFSSVVACGLIANFDLGVRAIASELLANIDWELSAVDGSVLDFW